MRRIFLFALLVTVAAAGPRTDFGVVFNDDADLAFVLPDRAKSEALLTANVAALADTPVKTLVYCIGMGGDLLYYNTTVASRVGWRKAPDETPGSLMEKRMENSRVCLAQGADAVRTAGEAARRIGLRFIPSLRMNDAHFMANPEQHSMTSEFWFKHRAEYTIKESPLAFQPAYGNLLDYSHAAVRQLRLDTVDEVLSRNRDLVDGFELDFNRFQVFFPKGRAAVGAPVITELVRAVRGRLDRQAKETGRPLYLFVRVPPSLDDCQTAGLEVERWIREGLVDLVSPAQIMTLAGDMPIADLVTLGRKHGVAIYPTLYPRTSWRVPFAPAGAERVSAKTFTRDATLEEIRGATAVYRHVGVDGFYLFNFYNAFGSTRPHDDRLYRVFRDVARPENLAGQSKVFAVTKSYYNDGRGSYAYGKSLPALLPTDGSLRVTLWAAEEPLRTTVPLAGCGMRVGIRSLPDDARVTITLNGHVLREGPWSTEGTKIRLKPKAKDAAEIYVHAVVNEPAWVALGANAVVVSVAGGNRTSEITDVELRFDYQNDYEKLWVREPVILNR